MKATNHLKSYGLTPRLKANGKIGLKGIGTLPEPIKSQIITWAKNNREKILDELDPNGKNVFTEKEAEGGTGLRIEPMTECLHGKQCRHLDAPGKRRPLCRKSEIHIFDLIACPFKHWTKSRDLKRKE